MEKGRRAGERSIRRGSEDEQGSGREQPAGKRRNEKGRGQGSSQRGRELTLDGPWLARSSSVRRRPSGFQAPRESRTSSGDERRGRAVATTSTDGDEQQRRLTGGDEQQGGARPAGRANGRRDRGILGGLSKCARGRAPSGKFSSARTRGDFFVPPLAHPPSRAIRPLPRRLVAAGRLDAHLGPKRRDGLRLASNRA